MRKPNLVLARNMTNKSIVEGLAARTIFERHLCCEIQLWQMSKGV
ncbi:hypothetical protein [Brasilonema sp. UFV-L1]|nr:hypothetical protein [Brasilonema sp. UFV-L1]